MQTVTVDEAGPVAQAMLLYGQSVDPASPYYADQTRMFSEKKWVNPPFCAKEVRKADAVAKVRKLRP